jgi:hypothetical protein
MTNHKDLIQINADSCEFNYNYYCPICKEWKTHKTTCPPTYFSTVQVCVNCFKKHIEATNENS